jgi:hypothetical protein
MELLLLGTAGSGVGRLGPEAVSSTRRHSPHGLERFRLASGQANGALDPRVGVTTYRPTRVPVAAVPVTTRCDDPAVTSGFVREVPRSRHARGPARRACLLEGLTDRSDSSILHHDWPYHRLLPSDLQSSYPQVDLAFCRSRALGRTAHGPTARHDKVETWGSRTTVRGQAADPPSGRRGGEPHGLRRVEAGRMELDDVLFSGTARSTDAGGRRRRLPSRAQGARFTDPMSSC